MNEALSRISSILAGQDGVVSRHQALRSGMSTAQVRYRLESGRWRIVHPSVYHCTEHRFTAAARVRAAGLWAGGQACLSGVAAAWWWGFEVRLPSEIEVVTPRTEHHRSRQGVRIVRRPLPDADRAWHRAAPVTSLPLTVLIASVQLGTEGPALLDRALQTRLTMDALRSAHYRNLGIRGSAAAGRLIHAAADRTAAASERLFLSLLKSAGIRGWRVNHHWSPLQPHSTIDVAFVRERLAIEIDGWAWHHAPDRFQRDRTKQNDLTLAGWTVLRFTWFDLTNDPEMVVRRVRNALARAR